MGNYKINRPEWDRAITRRKDANKRGPGNALWSTVATAQGYRCAECLDPIDPGMWSPRYRDAHDRAPWLLFREEPHEFAGEFAAVPENLRMIHKGCRDVASGHSIRGAVA
jgi:hypothetical protein